MDDADDFFADSASDTWPFKAAEIASIAATYPLGERLFNKLIAAARAFVLAEFSRCKPPHAARELLTLKAAFVKFRKAIGGMGPEARRHLKRHMQPALHEPDFTLARVEHVLWGFNHAHRAAFENLPPVPKGGRPDKKHEAQYYAVLRSLWETANNGKANRPFKAFRSACVEPLRRYRIRTLSEKGEYDKTRPARRRAAQSDLPPLKTP